jgi:hypothetical protein
MALREIKQLARSLKREQISKLVDWLHELIRRSDEDERRRKADAQHKIIEKREIDNKTYRLQGVRCGKEGCKCAAGELHGPYWYAYWSVQGKTKSQYVGKKLPHRKK